MTTTKERVRDLYQWNGLDGYFRVTLNESKSLGVAWLLLAKDLLV